MSAAHRLRRHDAPRPRARPRPRRARASPSSASTRMPRSSRGSSAGDLPVVEPGLDDLLRGNAARLAFTRRRRRACASATWSTSRPTCRPTTAARAISPASTRLIGAGARRHARRRASLVVLCQVPPGFTRARQRAGRALYYQVETLVFGRARRARAQARALHRRLRRSRAAAADGATRRSSPRSAARSCRCATRAPSWPRSRSTAAWSPRSASPTRSPSCARRSAPTGPRSCRRCKLDRRIGAARLSRAGPRHRRRQPRARPRDRDALLGGARHRRRRRRAPGVANSRHRRDWALRTLHARGAVDASRDAAVGVLGLAYKENTHSTKNSPSLALHPQPASRGRARVRSGGAAVGGPASEGRPARRRALEAPRRAPTRWSIMTPWPQFRELRRPISRDACSGRIVLDPYRVLDHAARRGRRPRIAPRRRVGDRTDRC